MANHLKALHWIEISRSALLSNLRLFRQTISPNTKLMAVVKANAYGHGLEIVAPIVAPYSDFLMVNTTEEALKIKNLLAERKLKKLDLKIKILIAAPISPVDFPIASKNHISLCAHSLEYLNHLQSLKHLITVHLKINTGTNRLGLTPSEIPAALKIIGQSKLILEGVYTHFHSSDSGSSATAKQFSIFQTIVQKLRILYPHILAHCASSSASLLLPPTRLDMIRLGISLYGLWPDPYVERHAPGKTLKSVLSWKCHPVQIRHISPGVTIGYNATYTYRKPGLMAVLPVGYSDGYDRKLTNCGRVWIAGQYCPVIGRVAMNFTMIDISDLKKSDAGMLTNPRAIMPREPAAIAGEGAREHGFMHAESPPTVELLGPHVTADEIATKIGTINYEIVSRLSPFIPRIIVR